MGELTNDAALGKLPVFMKIMASISIALGVVAAPVLGFLAYILFSATQEGYVEAQFVKSIVIFSVLLAVTAVAMVVMVVLGVRILRNKRRGAALTCEVLMVLNVIAILCVVMLFGINYELLYFAVVMVALVAMQSYVDPSLSEERELQRKLRDMDTKSQAEEGTLGRDLSGKGYITLNFFNLFWIFFVACVLGLILEVIFHMTVVEPGVYQDRAGMLYGPFSPIYGFGAVLMTVALNRFHSKPLIVIFLVSAVIGGAFEYAVSWFMEFSFGIVAWDYTGTFLSIDGRTNGMFMFMWGCLGIFWIKWVLPRMLKLVNMIPWNFRYSITTLVAVLMLADGLMTLASLDCWYERSAGYEPQNAMEEFCAEYYDNEFMENRFQSMTLNPENATRTDH